MNNRLNIRVYGIDGAVERFTLEDAELVSRTLAELHPTRLYLNDQITISDDYFQKTFAASRITRIDFVTEQLSVWDFPFSFGALSELTEPEFGDGIRLSEEANRKKTGSGMAVYLDLQMLDGLRSLLWMQIVDGLQSARLRKIYSLFKEPRLIFGLRAGGVGVLNLANLVHFAIVPEPPDSVPAEAARELDDRLIHLRSETRTASLQTKQL